MSQRAQTTSVPPGEELLGVLPLLAIGVFALNNFWLKRAIGNVVTGKLSDVTCCFFLPLVVSTALGYARIVRSLHHRVLIGCLMSAVVLTLVKTSSAASAVLDGAIAMFGVNSRNIVDPTDLIALIAVCCSYFYVARRFGPREEPSP